MVSPSLSNYDASKGCELPSFYFGTASKVSDKVIAEKFGGVEEFEGDFGDIADFPRLPSSAS